MKRTGRSIVGRRAVRKVDVKGSPVEALETMELGGRGVSGVGVVWVNGDGEEWHGGGLDGDLPVYEAD